MLKMMNFIDITIIMPIKVRMACYSRHFVFTTGFKSTIYKKLYCLNNMTNLMTNKNTVLLDSHVYRCNLENIKMLFLSSHFNLFYIIKHFLQA